MSVCVPHPNPQLSNYLFHLLSLLFARVQLFHPTGSLLETKHRLVSTKTCLRTPTSLTNCIPGPLTKLIHTVSVSDAFCLGGCYLLIQENNTSTPKMDFQRYYRRVQKWTSSGSVAVYTTVPFLPPFTV